MIGTKGRYIFKIRKERRRQAAVRAAMKGKGNIIFGLCIIGLFLSGCGQEQENDSALTAVNVNITEEDDQLKEKGLVYGVDYIEDAVIDDNLQDEEASSPAEESENGHVIAHNPDYQAPALMSESTKGADGKIIDGAFSYKIPEGYIDSIVDGSLVYVLEEEKGSHSIYIYTEDISELKPEDVLADYDISVKETFGLNAVSDVREYNGLEFTHYMYDDLGGEEHGFINVFVYAGSNGFIYIEFYDHSGVYDEADVELFMNSISLKSS